MSGAANKKHARFILHTLAPDTAASGQTSTAKDLRRCAKLVLAGKTDPKYALWLKSTLIPDLRASGKSYTANDLARCARAIGPRRSR